MKRPLIMLVAAFAVCAPAVSAQNLEFTPFGGGSFTTKKTVTAGSASADAGLKPGFAAGAAIGHNSHEYIGGEFRYMFQKHDLKLSSGSTDVSFGAQSHTLVYDLLFHTKPRDSRVRPYIAAGGGAKQYRGTGEERTTQPLSNLAILSKTDQLAGVISVGGGVKMRVASYLLFRVDVHDYIGPLPTEVIAPVPGATLSGWIHNIVPSVGLAFTF